MRPDFCVLASYDDHLFPTLAMGGDGAIPGIANFAPHIHVNIYKTFISGNIQESINWHRKLLKLLRVYDLDKPFIGIIKEACKLCGVPISTYVANL